MELESSIFLTITLWKRASLSRLSISKSRGRGKKLHFTHLRPGMPVFPKSSRLRISRFFSSEFSERAVWPPHSWRENLVEGCIKMTGGNAGTREGLSPEGVFTWVSLQRPKLWGRGPPLLVLYENELVRKVPMLGPLTALSQDASPFCMERVAHTSIRILSGMEHVQDWGQILITRGLWQAGGWWGSTGSPVSSPCEPLMLRTIGY